MDVQYATKVPIKPFKIKKTRIIPNIDPFRRSHLQQIQQDILQRKNQPKLIEQKSFKSKPAFQSGKLFNKEKKRKRPSSILIMNSSMVLKKEIASDYRNPSGSYSVFLRPVQNKKLEECSSPKHIILKKQRRALRSPMFQNKINKNNKREFCLSPKLPPKKTTYLNDFSSTARVQKQRRKHKDLYTPQFRKKSFNVATNFHIKRRNKKSQYYQRDFDKSHKQNYNKRKNLLIETFDHQENNLQQKIQKYSLRRKVDLVLDDFQNRRGWGKNVQQKQYFDDDMMEYEKQRLQIREEDEYEDEDEDEEDLSEEF